jgi:HSP20 family protein
MQTEVTEQPTPIKMYRGVDRLMVAVPMAGLEPEDIEIQVTEDGHLDIHGQLRGLLKGEKDVIADEWNPGPHHREVQLPDAVDGERANVTYNNGVLVVALPLAERTRAAMLRLEKAGRPAQGWRVGNAGTPPMPVSAAPKRETPAGRSVRRSR